MSKTRSNLNPANYESFEQYCYDVQEEQLVNKQQAQELLDQEREDYMSDYEEMMNDLPF